MRAAQTAALILLAGCAAEPDPAVLTRRAATYLWNTQHEDGGWHSQVHGLARSGQSWTAFTLFYLLRLPDRLYTLPEEKARQALAFIEANTYPASEAGAALGLADSLTLDYPVYATSYALRAYLVAQDRDLLTPPQERLIPKMVAYLLNQQMTEQHGIEPGHPAYGGWGFGSRPSDSLMSGARRTTVYTDLSHTRRALEALQDAARVDLSMRASTSGAVFAARRFLARTQKHSHPTYDGGFHYAPAFPDLNKGGMDEPVGEGDDAAPRSYATATCDGLLALLAAGYDVDTEPVQSAAAYLAAHDTLTYVSGLPESRALWRDVMFFYHLAGRAEVYARLCERGPWRSEIAHLLRNRQHPDGSFVNPFGRPNKEDDPFIATTLALAALHHSLQAAPCSSLGLSSSSE